MDEIMITKTWMKEINKTLSMNHGRAIVSLSEEILQYDPDNSGALQLHEWFSLSTKGKFYGHPDVPHHEHKPRHPREDDDDDDDDDDDGYHDQGHDQGDFNEDDQYGEGQDEYDQDEYDQGEYDQGEYDQNHGHSDQNGYK